MSNHNQPLVVTKPRIVVPEGNAERNLLARLCKMEKINDVQVLPKIGSEGLTRIGDQIVALDPFSGIEAVLIVADNDETPAANLKSVQDQIVETNGKMLNYALEAPSKAWTTKKGKTRVTIMMLPEAGVDGSVETLIWQAMTEAKPGVTTDVGGFLADKPTGQHDLLVKRHKAQVSTYISAMCKDDPDCTIGWMWQKKKKNRPLLKDPVFEPIIDMLRNF